MMVPQVVVHQHRKRRILDPELQLSADITNAGVSNVSTPAGICVYTPLARPQSRHAPARPRPRHRPFKRLAFLRQTAAPGIPKGGGARRGREHRRPLPLFPLGRGGRGGPVTPPARWPVLPPPSVTGSGPAPSWHRESQPELGRREGPRRRDRRRTAERGRLRGSHDGLGTERRSS
ncbi:hypothetical protein NDU88_000940 [Pleurodeles waltl]|uniref:Uncharacterized protein n=1 Tax=Pleurodeles waltl TaxID=8319 RepID=A0AAV7U5Q0_PLEWA|nr:hypothetical protein NDU88_000940 [Pleurodeles waltl]